MKGVHTTSKTGRSQTSVAALFAALQFTQEVSPATSSPNTQAINDTVTPAAETRLAEQESEQQETLADLPLAAEVGEVEVVAAVCESADVGAAIVAYPEENRNDHSTPSSEASDARGALVQAGVRDVSPDHYAQAKVYEADTDIDDRQIIAAAMIVAKSLGARIAAAESAFTGPATTPAEALAKVEDLVRQQALKDCLASKVETQVMMENAHEGNGVGPFTRAVLVDNKHNIDLAGTVACNS